MMRSHPTCPCVNRTGFRLVQAALIATFAAGAARTYAQPLVFARAIQGGVPIPIPGGNGVAPVILSIDGPSAFTFGQSGMVQFQYKKGRWPITHVIRTINTPLGQQTDNVPADYYGVAGAEGQGAFEILAESLAFGENTITLQLLDGFGNVSNSASHDITLAGAGGGGTAPAITNLGPTAPAWRLPPDVSYMPGGSGQRGRVTPTFALDYADPDADIELIRLTILANGGNSQAEFKASALYINGTAGSAIVRLLSLKPDSPPGIYELWLTPIDRAGNVGATVSTTVEITDSGGEPPIAISSFAPDIGPAGTEVVIVGTGFDASDPLRNRVTLAQLPAEVVAATPTELTVVVPDGAGTGKFMVRNDRGLAVSPEFFTMPPAVDVTPTEASLVVGTTQQFESRVTSRVYGNVVWSVDGVQGGNASVGTIDAAGLYTAPPGIPSSGGTPGVVTIRAEAFDDAALFDEARATILPPITLPGEGLVLQSAGGSVRSTVGRASISIPAGALPADGTITIQELYGAAAPAPEPGRQLQGAVALGPGGMTFTAPVSVTIPLARYFAPGTALDVSYYDPNTQTYDRGESLTAIVDESGERADAQVTHFSTVVIDARLPLISDNAPVVSLLSPSSAKEGLRVPVLISGAELFGDLTAEVLTETLQPTQDIVPDALYVNGTAAGITLHIQPILDLAEADPPRNYVLRLKRVNSQSETLVADATFTVVGLDEFGHQSDPAQFADRLVSRVLMGSNTYFRFRSSTPINLRVTGPVGIYGFVEGFGLAGNSAIGEIPGDVPLDSRGGRGGKGLSFLSMFDDWETWLSGLPESWGENGDRCSPFEGENPRSPEPCAAGLGGGRGGPPGDWNSTFTFLDILGFIIDVITCIADPALGCAVSVASDIIDVVDAALTDEDDSLGTDGDGGGAYTRPGGGGGGGGEVDGVVGGGGGGGGEGGARFLIQSADRIVVASSARVNLNGGAGGNGGVARDEEADVDYDGPPVQFDPNLPASHDFRLMEFPNHGGGGGGGAAGYFGLAAADRAEVASGSVSARAGANGVNGIALSDDRNSKVYRMYLRGKRGWRAAERGSTYYTDGRRGIVNLPDEARDRVTNRTFLNLVFPASDIPGTTFYFDTRCESSGQWIAHPVIGQETAHLEQIPLCEGFNTVPIFGKYSTSLPEQEELYYKKVLVFRVDTDGDGLADDLESYLWTDPTDPDTDDDGLTDGYEVAHGTNPLTADSDDDGVHDTVDPAPNDRDADDDGHNDGVELILGTDPEWNLSLPDELPEGSLISQWGGYLYLVDLPNRRIGLLGDVASGFNMNVGLAFTPSGTLYLAKDGALYTADPLTAATTLIGPFGEDQNQHTILSVQIAYNAVDGFLYGAEVGSITFPELAGNLLRIDPATGAATRVGAPHAESIWTLAADAYGRLYAELIDRTTQAGRLVELGTDNAIVREIAAVAGDRITGMTPNGPGQLLVTQAVDYGVKSRFSALDTATGQLAQIAEIDDRGLFALALSTAGGGPTETFTINEIGRYSVGPEARWVRAVWFANGLGNDIMTANFANDTLSLLRNNGDNTFAPAESIPVADGPTYFAGGYFRGYGPPAKWDVVVAHANAAVLSLLQDDGGGNFAPYTTLPLPAKARAVCVGNFNENVDDHFDIAALLENKKIHLLFGDGSGAFPTNATINLPGYDMRSIICETSDHSASLRLNNDSLNDLAVGDAAGFIYTLHGDGNGGFTLAQTLGGWDHDIFSCGHIAAARIDPPFRHDLVLPEYFSGRVHVYYNDQTGAFPTRLTLEDDTYPWMAAVLYMMVDEQYAAVVTPGNCSPPCHGSLYVYENDGSGCLSRSANSPFLNTTGSSAPVLDVGYFGGTLYSGLGGTDLVTTVSNTNEVVVLQLNAVP